jgi:pyridoxine 5-phosphate synthase
MRLCINIDHVATLRNARGGSLPDPVEAALVCERAGADGIVCHLREDRRHIRDADVKRLRDALTTKLDLEMAATPEIIAIARRIVPDLVTLVPEKRRELTTEGGLDIVRSERTLRRAVERFHEKGIPVSLFVDPVAEQIEMSKEIGADMIELHTGEYANARTAPGARMQLRRIAAAAKLGRSLGLTVNAGHGLNYGNMRPVKRIREIEEVSIGHAVIVRAVEVGLESAVKEMVRLLK